MFWLVQLYPFISDSNNIPCNCRNLKFIINSNLNINNNINNNASNIIIESILNKYYMLEILDIKANNAHIINFHSNLFKASLIKIFVIDEIIITNFDNNMNNFGINLNYLEYFQMTIGGSLLQNFPKLSNLDKLKYFALDEASSAQIKINDLEFLCNSENLQWFSLQMAAFIEGLPQCLLIEGNKVLQNMRFIDLYGLQQFDTRLLTKKNVQNFGYVGNFESCFFCCYVFVFFVFFVLINSNAMYYI